MKQLIESHFDRHYQALQAARELSGQIEECARALITALSQGKKMLIMGNGGSAADAQHFAAEMVGRFLMKRRALPALALTTDSSILTAVGNDFGYDEVFRRQVEGLAVAGDVVFGISTSGHSNNVFHALTKANEIGCKTIGLLGKEGGNIAGIVDIPVIVPAKDTPAIQEIHITLIHILCELVEKGLFSPSSSGR